MGNNAFEAGTQKNIPAVLVYAERDEHLLMLHRNAKPGQDYHDGKWNGLGGKCEPGESPIETAARELAEESGLQIASDRFQVLGTLQFPNFKPQKNEDWFVFVLRVDISASEQPWTSGPEGDLVWIPKNKILDLNLWQGDRHFIPYVLERSTFVGTLWYEGQNLARSWIQKL